MQGAPRPSILAIDLLRFACALAVMASHFTAALPMQRVSPVRFFDSTIMLPEGAAPYGWFGWVGVEIFFVISGYVIAMSGEAATPLGFVRRRVLRLAPAAWICVSLTALVMLAGSMMPTATIAGRWLAALIFYPLNETLDGSYWTLSIEICFYLLVAVGLIGGGPGRIERIGLGLGAASLGFWIAVLALGVPAPMALENPTLNLTLMPHGIFFALGVVLWGVRAEGWTPLRGIAAATLFVAGCGEVAFHAGSMDYVARGLLNPSLPVLAFAGGIGVILGAGRLQAGLGRWIGPARLGMLGLMTYPLYLLHRNIGAGLIVAMMHAGIAGWIAVPLAAVAVIALAWAVTIRAEPVVRRWLAAQMPSAPFSPRRGRRTDSLPSAFPPAG